MAGSGVMQCGQVGRLGLRGSGFEGLRKVGVTQTATLRGRMAGAGRSRAKGLAVRCGKEEVKVRVRLDHQIQFGEMHAILGSAKSFGAWQDKVLMKWTESKWVVDLEGKPRENVE